MNNLGADEKEYVKLKLSQMPTIRPEFLNLVIDIEGGRDYEDSKLIVRTQQPVTDDFSAIYHFFFGNKSLIIYILTLIFLTVSIAQEYYFIAFRDMRFLLILNFILIGLCIVFGNKTQKRD